MLLLGLVLPVISLLSTVGFLFVLVSHSRTSSALPILRFLFLLFSHSLYISVQSTFSFLLAFVTVFSVSFVLEEFSSIFWSSGCSVTSGESLVLSNLTALLEAMSTFSSSQFLSEGIRSLSAFRQSLTVSSLLLDEL